jgi:methionyl-tRNA synthetase
MIEMYAKNVCADDAHGTAIMLRAEANGISPEEQIANVQKEHIRDFDGFVTGRTAIFPASRFLI